MPTGCDAFVCVVEGKRPLAVEVRPTLPPELWSRVFGAWCRVWHATPIYNLMTCLEKAGCASVRGPLSTIFRRPAEGRKRRSLLPARSRGSGSSGTRAYPAIHGSPRPRTPGSKCKSGGVAADISPHDPAAENASIATMVPPIIKVTAWIASVTITAASPPTTVYTPASPAKTPTLTHMGTFGYNTCTTTAPAKSPPAASRNRFPNILNPENARRERTSKRFSRNSGTVNIRERM